MSSCLFYLCSRNSYKYDGSKKQLKTVPREIGSMQKYLLELNLESNMIKTFEKNIFQCKKLKYLNLCSNHISEIPDGIGELVFLEELCISNNDLNTISDNIRCCHRLIFLDLSRNYIERIPYGMTQLRNLQYLHLNEVSLVDLPPSISCLCNLRVLEARSNLIKEIPESISFMSNLIRLDLGCNEITSLPTTIGQLESLEELWLDSNIINELCKEIGELRNLNLIDISNNPIKTLPEEFSKLENLTDLTLSKCQIVSFPDTIGKLKKLSMLKADCNQLKELPSSFCELEELSEVFLRRNKLFELPQNIGNLKELILLDIDYNSLVLLPSSICKCSKLSILLLSDNQLEGLPSNIGDLSKLVVIDIRGNNIRFLPFSLASCEKIQSIWISENQQKPIIPMQVVDDPVYKRVLTNILLPQKSANLNNNINMTSVDEVEEFNMKTETSESSIPEYQNVQDDSKKDDETLNDVTEKINKLCQINALSSDNVETTSQKEKDVKSEVPIPKMEKIQQNIRDFDTDDVTINVLDILDGIITIEAVEPNNKITFGLKDFNLFITHIIQEELKNPNLRVGDRILEINDEKVSTIDVSKFDKLIENELEIRITVRHDPPFEKIKFVAVDRTSMTEPLGLKLKKMKLKSNPSKEFLTITANISSQAQIRDFIFIGDIIVGIDSEELIPGNIKVFEKLISDRNAFTLVIYRQIETDIAD